MLKIENLYIQYKQDVYRYLMSLTHNPALSEDLLSETFLKVIYSLHTYKGDSSIKTWIFGIARNLWLQQLRGLKPNVEFNDLLEIYISEGIENNLITKLSVDRVYELLSEKDEQTQRIVNMRINGYSYREIAEATGISENSARVVDFRIKKWLGSVLEREGLK